MVVDVKRSSKANSERDRCVLVRARVNGSFDAEIIESGELLINIHPNVIRIPSLPGADDKRICACEYEVGQKVSCRAGKYGRWFDGYVEKVLPAGHYKIEFADGTVEESVSHKRMRPVRKSNEKDPSNGFDIALLEHDYYVGQEVLMRFSYGCKWRLCTITKVRCGGEAYDVLLNGRQEVEKGISRSCLRHQGSMLYGYGDDYCPSQRALVRCAAAKDTTEATTNMDDQNRVVVSADGNHLKTPLRTPLREMQVNNHYHTTSKKGNRQLEEGGMLAVSRSDRNIEAKRFMSPAQTPVRKVLPMKQERGMAEPPSSTIQVTPNASNGVVISTLRDRFVQEMHRNVSLLNTSATERKYARIIRHERRRMDSVVLIQAVIRGFIVRSRISFLAKFSESKKKLKNEEVELATAQLDLVDRYMQALSVAVFRNEPENDDHSTSPPAPTNSLAAMKKVAALITSDNIDEVEMQDEVVVDQFDEVTDPLEKMKLEMIDIHNQQLKKQRDEMKELFAREMKGLGTQIMKQMNHEDELHPSQSGLFLSHHTSVQDTDVLDLTKASSHHSSKSSMLEDEPVFGFDDTIVQDIDWMKDMYLDIWGGSNFDAMEIVSIIAKSKTNFTVLEASLPGQLRNVVHMAEGGQEYVKFHHVFFVKSPENKDNFLMKVRLDNSSGKACKLKCPGDKIADLCENKRTVKITLDSKNQFEISSSSLRLDGIVKCLERLWDAHIGWMAQKLLIRIALHRIIQGICVLLVSLPALDDATDKESDDGNSKKESKEEHDETHGNTEISNEIPFDNDGNETERKENDENDVPIVVVSPRPLLHTRWISQRYILFQELSNIIKSGQEQYQLYQQTLQTTQNELISIIENWRFFQYGSASNPSQPVQEMSEELYQLAITIFTSFEMYFSSEVSFMNTNGIMDMNLIKETLLSTHNQDTIQPILTDIYTCFVRLFSVEEVFEEFFLSNLLTMSHQRLVKAYAYAETYDWKDLFGHTRSWSFFLQVLLHEWIW